MLAFFEFETNFLHPWAQILMVLASEVNFALPVGRAFERHGYVSDSTLLTPENNPGYLKLSF
jgi:hypothetical protein